MPQTTAIQISVINASTVLTDTEIRPVVNALQQQVTNDFRPAWGVDAELTFVPSGSTPPIGTWWLTILDDSDQALEGRGVFHRGASEFHHHNIVASFKSAWSLCIHRIRLRSLRKIEGKQKPTARSLLAVGSVVLLKIALLHPIPSSRRHVVIRVDIPVPVDVIRVAFWMRVVMKIVAATQEQLQGKSTGLHGPGRNSKFR